jgi:hypothetical protein
MYRLITCLALLTGTISNSTFYSCHRNRNDAIRSLRVIVDIPVVSRDGALMPNKDFFNVYYRGDLIMYRLNYKFDSSFKGELVAMEVRSHFFVYQKNATVGYKYDPHRPENSDLQFSVDSLLQKNALQNFQWHQVPLMAKSVFSGTDSAVFKEVYVGPDTYNKAHNDSIIFYYSDKFKTFDFSFSKVLDSVRGHKLFKIRLLYPEVYSKEHKITFPRRESHFEMQEGKIDDEQEITRYFDNFMRDHLKG